MHPEKLAADTAYGSGGNLAWLLAREITPHIPVLDHSSQTGGVFTRNEFFYDRDADICVCPSGKALHRATIGSDNGLVIYHAREADCAGCALKAQCTKADYRSLSVNAYGEERQQVAALARTDEFRKSFFVRRKVEMLFARHHRRARRMYPRCDCPKSAKTRQTEGASPPSMV